MVDFIVITSDKLTGSIYRLMEEMPAKDIPAFVHQQFKSTIRTVVEITPPGSKDAKGLEARRRGEATVAGDIGKIFTPVARKAGPDIIEEQATLATIHEGLRRRGRVFGKKTGIANQKRARKAVLAQYIRKKQAGVGKLASGWGAAAARLGVSLPAWIRRHGARGLVLFENNSRGIGIRARNTIPYAAQVGAARRIRHAADMQARALDRRLKEILRRKAAGLGFKTR
ncbi:MAG: hypothetical protein AB7I98_03895 [Verrucomicrobiales bacterium]